MKETTEELITELRYNQNKTEKALEELNKQVKTRFGKWIYRQLRRIYNKVSDKANKAVEELGY